MKNFSRIKKRKSNDANSSPSHVEGWTLDNSEEKNTTVAVVAKYGRTQESKKNKQASLRGSLTTFMAAGRGKTERGRFQNVPTPGTYMQTHRKPHNNVGTADRSKGNRVTTPIKNSSTRHYSTTAEIDIELLCSVHLPLDIRRPTNQPIGKVRWIYIVSKIVLDLPCLASRFNPATLSTQHTNFFCLLNQHSYTNRDYIMSVKTRNAPCLAECTPSRINQTKQHERAFKCLERSRFRLILQSQETFERYICSWYSSWSSSSSS